MTPLMEKAQDGLLGYETLAERLPDPLRPLADLAYNLWWTWDPEAIRLLQSMAPDRWTANQHSAIRMLRAVSEGRLDELAGDPSFLGRMNETLSRMRAYLGSDSTWYDRLGRPLPDGPIAYFSAEYGIHECLPIYSGGLGILAGDHCKAASDLGLPFVAVGLLYRYGYGRQQLDHWGWQMDVFAANDFANLPVRRAKDAEGRPIHVPVEILDRTLTARVWTASVGRITLYLLDTDDPLNTEDDRRITAQLYGGDREMRIQQEIVLGIGGVRALRACGVHPGVFHMNEGHAAFLGLERIRETMRGEGASFDDALKRVARRAVFTTHTPVPAGHDYFSPDRIFSHFGGFCNELGVPFDRLLDVGRPAGATGDQPFNMTVLALRSSAARNGVSKLHGEVSRRMFADVFPGTSMRRVPIGSVTNGVHTPTWLAPELRDLLEKYAGSSWWTRMTDPSYWNRVLAIPDGELWAAHMALKERLVRVVRFREKARRVRLDLPPEQVAAADRLLDPATLTLGFARRFAPYKRATLLLRDVQRLRGLLGDAERPVQIVFAGKSHPQDRRGKELLQQVFQTSHDPGLAGRLVFVEDYDMDLGRTLVQGVDVWLNTPRRPHEASGTSGMKAAMNGVPNCSILDGWWPEGFRGTNGWAIGEEGEQADTELQDAMDSASLYQILERQVVPLYYDRAPDGLAHGWVRLMKEAIRTGAPVFNTNRMVEEYFTDMYLPVSRG
ncbi:MAG: alpha-glucan phosphorylase [Myxococcales bacterium]